MKALKSRTVWMGVVVTVLGVVQTFAPALPISPLYQGVLAIAVGILIVVLRFDTDDAIADK